MITFISGGVRSGKSSFAEHYILGKDCHKIYLATAIAYDDEMKERVKIHRRTRMDKGWNTIEKPTSISEITTTEKSVILLDCLTNLVANEMYLNKLSIAEVIDKIFDDLMDLSSRSLEVVIVSNDVFSGIDDYSVETVDFMKALGYLHCKITQVADSCYELNYSIATKMKG
jgi:adenosylcobinamide kinase/adenosylcobinamide-phosphate guanylyltransferase